tara:strand:+ start:902 stop:2614 length:1713 start_codon:yes stop_codon:yes gene_type:complete
MPGIFKKLNAQDIKITPFEAHKQYNTTNLSSIGAQTASLAWSGKNKSTFGDNNKKYYQIDKLYYRNYIQERAYRFELNDATYTTQERRLYQSASLLSLSQKTFGSEVQPETFELSITRGGKTFNIKDDGFGNLYDTSLKLSHFPNEDNRVFYLSPVQAFKRKDLTINPVNGSTYVNNPYTKGFNGTFFDDSYFQNTISYENIVFTSSNNTGFNSVKTNNLDSCIRIAHTPILNFENDESFTITFNYEPQEEDWIASNRNNTSEYNIISKEGHKIVPSTPSETTQYTPLSSSNPFTTEPVGPQFPYRLYYKGDTPNSGTASLFFERSDGEVTQVISASFFESQSSGIRNVRVMYEGASKQTFLTIINAFPGTLFPNVSVNSLTQGSQPILSKSPTNKADIYVYKRALPDGTFGNRMSPNSGQLSQLMIFNKGLTDIEYKAVSQSITGTPNIGNIFYDNGFAILTHPSYMDLFDGGTLNTLKYKNTHLITENEYQCTINEEEFEFTNNLSARKVPLELGGLANFATGSNFKPYITTIGLHDDNGNLLVVGKLAQPIKASSETDTTFVIRFDT